MELKEIKISLETAQRWYNGTDEELKGLALQTFPEIAKKELPKTWEELGEISGFCVSIYSEIKVCCDVTIGKVNRNVFTTKEQADASISTAMYSQLLQAYKEVSITEFIVIAKEYEPKVRPILELFFGQYAEASFYYGLLGKLRDEYRQGWVPNWMTNKYYIEFYNGIISKDIYDGRNHFLSFQNEEKRDLFIDNFRKLIEKAKPLFS